MITALISIERNNTILYCKHWEETVRFYRERLALPVAFEKEWFVEFRLTSTSNLSVADSSRASIADVLGQGITLTWKVADIDAARDSLVAAGVSVTTIKRKWNARVCYFHDPEGHRVELWADGGEQS